MRALALTRVDWHMGQALLPEHFRTQEESLRAESILRFSLLAKPYWGLGELSWDPARLRGGVFSVDRMALVLESGRIVSVPGNASQTMLDLTSTGLSQTSVYLLLKGECKPVALRTPDRNGSATDAIRRLEVQVELSTGQSSGEETFKLAEVHQDAEGAWAISDAYIPPLLCVRPGMLFDAYLKRMDGLVVRLRELLARELQENHLSGETHVLAKQALRGLFGLAAMLTDVRAEVRPHPQDLYEKLRTLLIDMAVLRDVSPAAATEFPYRQCSLGDCFGDLLAELEEIAARGHRSAPYVKFARGDGLCFCALPKTARAARSVYLMVHKPEVAARLQLGRVKLASPKRLALLHERALPGIPCTAIERPPFSQVLSSAIDFYALGSGQEWDAAVAEGQVVLYDNETLKDCDLYLYFRAG
jgi:type VI secretion system protein ImpJ